MSVAFHGDGLSQVWLDVTLLTEGATIAATQNDISYDGQNTTVIGCVKNDDLDKDISYAFYPAGCVQSECNRIRVFVLSTSNQTAIPDGSVLYRCLVNIDVSAPDGVYLFDNEGAKGSDIGGNPVAITPEDGGIGIGVGGC